MTEPISPYDHLRELMDERDRRYQQRDEDRQRAVDAALASAEKAVTAALVAADRAVAKAELAADKRFDSVNEFRGQLNDQATTFLSRNEYAAQHESLEDKVQALTDRINSSQGKAEGSQLTKGNYYAALGAVATVLGILVLLANNVFH